MAAEQVLELYDSYWFELQIFTNIIFKQTEARPIATTSSVSQNKHQVQELNLSIDVRSQSLYCLCSDTSFSPSSPSPDSVIVAPQLQRIVSGEEAKLQEEVKPLVSKKKEKRHYKRNKKGSKSLSNLEFEELKGFMDLGFVFSEEDKDSSLVSILPGLQRFGRKDGEEEATEDNSKVSRPYLSEAWDVLEQTKPKLINPLVKLRFPAADGRVDMKDHIRLWARSVASAVK